MNRVVIGALLRSVSVLISLVKAGSRSGRQSTRAAPAQSLAPCRPPQLFWLPAAAGDLWQHGRSHGHSKPQPGKRRSSGGAVPPKSAPFACLPF